MRYRHLLLAIGLCAISTTANANSQAIGIAKPAAVICVGIAVPTNDGQFELACQIHQQDTHNAKGGLEGRQPLPVTKSDNRSEAEIAGCNEPGDVIEQGFCLD